MSEKKLYTEQGLRELKDELTFLTRTRREEVKEHIAEARSFGDLSENAEYNEARTEQAQIESRILELEDLIENATLVDEQHMDVRAVSLGSCVRLFDEDLREETTYHIVGSNEADPANFRISDQSPIGHALMGRKAEERVVVTLPGGDRRRSFRILEVTRTPHHKA